MNLVALRQKFVELSGRYDLVVDATDWADNGADFFLNEGHREVQRRLDLTDVYSRVYRQLSTDSWYVDEIGQVRSIECVWVSTSEKKWKLTKKDLGELRQLFPYPITETDSGAPLYWALNTGRVVDNTDKDAEAAFFDREGTSPKTTDSILILPPNEESVVVEVWGHFYTPEVSADSDTSWLLESHPFAVLYAALMHLETTYRNTTGRNDWLRALTDLLLSIDDDIVVQEGVGITGPKG